MATARNLAILSREEIRKRALDLKRMVEQDMTAQPTEAIKQLMRKIKNFKSALKWVQFVRYGALTMILQELHSIEQHVAQASADCLDVLEITLVKASVA